MADNCVKRVLSFLLLIVIIQQCVAPPTKNKEPGAESEKKDEQQGTQVDDLGLEYNRYLKEVVDALESDPEFRKKLETAEEADFRNGKVASELEYVNHHVRSKLNELKRTELERLRELMRQQEELARNEVSPEQVQVGHIDHANPHTFESADLHKLITQVRMDLAEADRKRREEFKEYELQKKFEREQKIKTMDEEHKTAYLKELEEQKKRHEKHEPQLHHPGSKVQLEEVWEKEDHMEKQQFNPRTFFLLHDVDGNGYWDEDEVKALFVKELDKLYKAGAPEDDMREREEEMERMREHVFKESDTNGDRLISYEEFLEQTKKQEFNRDEGWETVDSQPQFTQQEYEEFERRRQEEIQRLIDQGLLQPYAPGMMAQPAYDPRTGQIHYAPPANIHPNQLPQQYAQQYGHHPQGVQPQYGAQVQYGGQQYGGHPNQLPPQYHAPQHPNMMPQHPNQVPQHPNQMPQHPNQVPQHPNQVPQHPNQMPQHPNQVPQHPNQVPQHPNQMPQHPNQVPQHPNQMPQQPNQMPQHYNQQVPQHQASNQQAYPNQAGARSNDPPQVAVQQQQTGGQQQPIQGQHQFQSVHPQGPDANSQVQSGPQAANSNSAVPQQQQPAQANVANPPQFQQPAQPNVAAQQPVVNAGHQLPNTNENVNSIHSSKQ